jgi:iron complex outermembrane recepter protein
VDQQSILSRYPEFARRKFQLDSVDLDWDLGFAKLHSSTSQFEDKRVGEADYTSQGELFYFRLGDAGGRIDSGRSAFITFNNTYKGTSHETRLTSKGDGPLQWIAGLYYTKQDRSLRFSEFLPGIDNYVGIPRTASGSNGNVDEGYRENLASSYKEKLGTRSCHSGSSPWVAVHSTTTIRQSQTFAIIRLISSTTT